MISLKKMAVPMRFVNVRHRITNIIISHRRLTLNDNRIVVNRFSHKSNEDPSNQENEGEEDFFGIPLNFKLQHVRHITNAQLTSDKTSPQADTIHATGDSLSHVSEEQNHQDRESGIKPDVKSHVTRRERRLTSQASFSTRFGSITLDRSVADTSIDDLAIKAQEILTKLSTESVKNKTSSSDKIENKKNPTYTKERTVKEENKADARKRSSLDSSNPSCDIRATTSNYFDEMYFPEHSADEKSIVSEQTPIQKTVAESTNLHYLESQHTSVHSSLSEMNISAELKGIRGTSIHGEHNESSLVHSVNLIDETYFGSVLNESNKKPDQDLSHHTRDSLSMKDRDFQAQTKTGPQNISQTESPDLFRKQTLDFNEIDRQYFGDTFQKPNSDKDNITDEMTTVTKDKNSSSLYKVVNDYTDQLTLNRINKEPSLTNETDQPQRIKRRLKKASEKQGLNDQKDQLQLNPVKKDPLSANVTAQRNHDMHDKKRLNDTPAELNADNNFLSNEHFLNKQKKTISQVQANLEKPETAYDVAMKIRHDLKHMNNFEEKSSDDAGSFSQTTDDKQTESGIRLDSKGFRVLEDQVPNLDRMTSADIVRMLKSRIIFDHEDFLAIDKPYGLPCFSQSKDRVSVTELLPAFAEHLPRSYKANDLHLVQGLDRDVTGAIIFAKNPEVAYMLRGMYKNSDLITQRFWAITKGVPSPLVGVIDIPLGEAKVAGIYKMVLRPRFLKDEKLIGRTSKAPSEKAITQYSVLSSYGQSALVECILLTNVKHQIRLHLASGLSTPILGDHKYSNFSKLAPQKLHREMLQLLKIRQAKVRHLALHLHCRSIILKDYKGRMIFLTTHPPSHFRDNMRNLRIPKLKM